MHQFFVETWKNLNQLIPNIKMVAKVFVIVLVALFGLVMCDIGDMTGPGLGKGLVGYVGLGVGGSVGYAPNYYSGRYVAPGAINSFDPYVYYRNAYNPYGYIY